MKTIITDNFKTAARRLNTGKYPKYVKSPLAYLIAERLLNNRREFFYNPKSECLVTGNRDSVDCAFYMEDGGHFIHNHPGSNTTPWPSEADLALARRFHCRRMNIVAPKSGTVLVMESKNEHWPMPTNWYDQQHMWEFLTENHIQLSVKNVREYEYTLTFFDRQQFLKDVKEDQTKREQEANDPQMKLPFPEEAE